MHLLFVILVRFIRDFKVHFEEWKGKTLLVLHVFQKYFLYIRSQ